MLWLLPLYKALRLLLRIAALSSTAGVWAFRAPIVETGSKSAPENDGDGNDAKPFASDEGAAKAKSPNCSSIWPRSDCTLRDRRGLESDLLLDFRRRLESCLEARFRDSRRDRLRESRRGCRVRVLSSLDDAEPPADFPCATSSPGAVRLRGTHSSFSYFFLMKSSSNGPAGVPGAGLALLGILAS